MGTTTTAQLDGEDVSISKDNIAPDNSEAAAAEPSAENPDAPDSNMSKETEQPARSEAGSRRNDRVRKIRIVALCLPLAIALLLIGCYACCHVGLEDDFLAKNPDDTEKPDDDSENQLDDDANEQA